MRKVLWIALGVIAGALGGHWLGGREVPMLRTRVAELEKRPVSCAPSGLARLGDAWAAIERARAQTPRVPARAPAPTVKALPEGHSSFEVSVDRDDDDDSGKTPHPRDGGVNLLAVAGKLSGESAAALARMKHELALSDEQEKLFKAGVDDMNTRVGAALDKLVTLPDHPRSRDVAPVAIDMLAALKDADDTFRSALTNEQRATLDHGDFDVASQLDPLLLLHLFKNRDVPNQDAH